MQHQIQCRRYSVSVYAGWAKNGTKFLYANNFIKY